MKRIKDLEVAKETLKALKAPVSLDAIDQYLIDECPLSESNRFELNLSASKVQEAQKVPSVSYFFFLLFTVLRFMIV